MAGFTWDLMAGEDFMGEELFAPKSLTGVGTVPGAVGFAWSRFVPLFIQDMEEGWRVNEGTGAGLSTLSGLGAGVTSYETVADVAEDVYNKEFSELEPYQQKAATQVYHMTNQKGSDYTNQRAAFDKELQDQLWTLNNNPMNWDKRQILNSYYSAQAKHSGQLEGLNVGTFGENSQYERPQGGTPEELAALQEYYDFIETNTIGATPLFDIPAFNKKLLVLEAKWAKQGTLEYVQRNTHTTEMPPQLFLALPSSTQRRILASYSARKKAESK